MDPDVARVSNLILRATDFVLRPWYRWSGLDRLAAQFPALEQALESLLTGETIRLNNVKWRGVVALGLTDHGLYLRVATSPAALIPWERVVDGGAARLYGRRAHTIVLGVDDPVSLVVYDGLYQRMAPRLR